jgi:hypothetical protein
MINRLTVYAASAAMVCAILVMILQLIFHG